MFSYGVFPVYVSEHPTNWKPVIKEKLQSVGVEGNLVVLTEGPSRQRPDRDNRMAILDLSR
jgi:pyruvate kinase